MRGRGGLSRNAEWHRRRASEWGRWFAAGDRTAAFHLSQRACGLKAIKLQGGAAQAALMRRANAIKREQRDEAKRRQERLAAVREVNQARAQYGTSSVCGTPVRQLLPGERCHYPTLPLRGAKCPQCGWTFGKDIEPHPIGGVPADIALCGYLAVCAEVGLLVTCDGARHYPIGRHGRARSGMHEAAPRPRIQSCGGGRQRNQLIELLSRERQNSTPPQQA